MSRNARSPSCPSGETRWAAMARAVSAATSSGDRPHTVGDERLGGRHRVGAAARNSRDVALHGGVEFGGRHDRVHQADVLGAWRRRNACPVRNSSRAADAPDLGQHERRDHRRQDAQLRLGEAEDACATRRRRCRTRPPGPRRRRAPRRGPCRSRHRQGVRRRANMAVVAVASRTFSSWLASAMRAIQAASAPAQKTLPAPAMTTTRTPEATVDAIGPLAQLGNRRRR